MRQFDQAGIREIGFIRALWLLLLFCMWPFMALGQTQNISYKEIISTTSFVVVVDRSGSMSGSAINGVKLGVFEFMDAVSSLDRVALVSFASDVRQDVGFTTNRDSVKSGAYGLTADGSTRLYDAIAKAAQILSGEKGLRAIVYLTDGDDTGSTITMNEIRQMNLGERVIVYGIGLGSVNHTQLRQLSDATGGLYRTVSAPAELRQVYREIVGTYYSRAGRVSDQGALLITSVPGGKSVRFSGKEVGTTPFSLPICAPGAYEVEVSFNAGTWKNAVDVKAGWESRINAKESDLPGRLYLESAPTGAAVFIDGNYIGLTSLLPSSTRGGETDLSGQLAIDGLSQGQHRIRMIAVPDQDFSEAQVMEFDFTMGKDSVHVKASIFMGKATDNKGRSYGSGPVLPSNLRKF